MEKPGISFFAMDAILLFAVIGFIFTVFDLHGLAFIFELGLLLVFMFFLAFAMFFVYHNKSGSWGIISAVLVLMLFDVFVIFLLTRKFGIAYISTLVFAIAGLVVALLNIISAPKKETEEAEIQYDKAKYYYPSTDKIEAKPSEPAVEKTFTPGKYVASRKANKFHSPKCDWALRISKENQVWFDSKEEAQSKGLEADKCVA